MFAIMPTPIFSFDATLPLPPLPVTVTANTPLAQTRYRPSVSSPLSSSPIRASSYSPPTSPPDVPAFLFAPQKDSRPIARDTQSSPIAPGPKPLFRFANRTPRPNPVVQKREEARESRRKLFLKNVRERTDDRNWERRGGDQEVLRLEWARLNAELRQQKEADLAVFGPTDAEIEEATQLQQLQQQQQEAPLPPPDEVDIDDMMVDAIAREEEAEIEALLSSMPETTDRDGDRSMGDDRPESIYFSDDDDYDALFMELSQQEMASSPAGSSQDMVFSQQDTEMS